MDFVATNLDSDEPIWLRRCFKKIKCLKLTFKALQNLNQIKGPYFLLSLRPFRPTLSSIDPRRKRPPPPVPRRHNSFCYTSWTDLNILKVFIKFKSDAEDKPASNGRAKQTSCEKGNGSKLCHNFSFVCGHRPKTKEFLELLFLFTVRLMSSFK